MTKDKQHEWDEAIKGKWDNRSLVDAAETFMLMGKPSLAEKATSKLSRGDSMRYMDELFNSLPKADQADLLKMMKEDIERKEKK